MPYKYFTLLGQKLYFHVTRWIIFVNQITEESSPFYLSIHLSIYLNTVQHCFHELSSAVSFILNNTIPRTQNKKSNPVITQFIYCFVSSLKCHLSWHNSYTWKIGFFFSVEIYIFSRRDEQCCSPCLWSWMSCRFAADGK